MIVDRVRPPGGVTMIIGSVRLQADNCEVQFGQRVALIGIVDAQ